MGVVGLRAHPLWLACLTGGCTLCRSCITQFDVFNIHAADSGQQLVDYCITKLAAAVAAAPSLSSCVAIPIYAFTDAPTVCVQT